MSYPQKYLKNEKKGNREIFLTLSYLAEISTDNSKELERFLQEVVNKTSEIIKADKISLNFSKKFLSDFKTPKGDYSVSIPITVQQNNVLLGYLRVNKARGKHISEKELSLLKIIAQIIGLKFQNNAFQQVIYEGLTETLKVLVNVVEAKDVYTRFHSQQVAHYALGIGKQMGLSQDLLDTLKIASILHDIGKLAIPDNILLKPGKLTPEEFEIIKLHPIVGDEILKPLRFFHQERKIIRHHHERWDGTGYPDGLFGENIPLLSSIMAVADSFDAMTSERVYHKAKPAAEALEEIKSLSGVKYNPRVVNAFEIFLKKEYDI